MAAGFALDVENRRVQNAMATMGIEEAELMIKSLEDFAGPRVTPEIQALRFEYHKKKLQETVKKIKYKIREDRQRLSTVMTETNVAPVKVQHSAPFSTRELSKAESLATFLSHEEQKLTQIREKQKQLLLKTYFQSTTPSPKPVERAPNPSDDTESTVQETLSKKKADFEKKQQRHKDKIAEIRKQKAEMQRELVRNMTKSMREHEERGRQHEEMKRSEVLARAASYQDKKREIAVKLREKQSLAEEELDEKLMELEMRIDRNRRLHEEELKTKAEKAGKWSSKGEGRTPLGGLKGSEEVERIKRYVTAQMQARTRKQDLATTQLSKFEEQRKKTEAKLANMEKIKKAESDSQMKKIRFLERKMKTASLVIERKKKDWGKELELRMEQQRLMDEDKRTKVERAQRIYVLSNQNLRREKLLDKLIMDKEKADKKKRDKMFCATKHHEIAIRIMIEKEKTKEIQSLVARSPKSKAAQEKLKMLEIKVKSDDLTSIEEKPTKE